MRGWNCSACAGTTSRCPWKTIVGPPSAPTVAASTGRPLKTASSTSMSRASSQPLMNPAHERMPSGFEVSQAISLFASAHSSTGT